MFRTYFLPGSSPLVRTLIKNNNRHFDVSRDVPGNEGQSRFEKMLFEDEVMAEPAQ